MQMKLFISDSRCLTNLFKVLKILVFLFSGGIIITITIILITEDLL